MRQDRTQGRGGLGRNGRDVSFQCESERQLFRRTVRYLTLRIEYPLGDSNPCFRTENPTSWASRRRGQIRENLRPPKKPLRSQLVLSAKLTPSGKPKLGIPNRFCSRSKSIAKCTSIVTVLSPEEKPVLRQFRLALPKFHF